MASANFTNCYCFRDCLEAISKAAMNQKAARRGLFGFTPEDMSIEEVPS